MAKFSSALCVCLLYVCFVSFLFHVILMDNAPIISLPPTLLTQEIVYMWHILLKDLGSRGELHLEEANSLKENFRHLDS